MQHLTLEEVRRVADEINAEYSDVLYDECGDEGGEVFKNNPAVIVETDGRVVHIKIFGAYMWSSIDTISECINIDEGLSLHLRSVLLMYIREFGNLVNKFNESGLDS